MSSPIYKHDCTTCIFLGNDILEDTPVDVYVCPQILSPTIVIRYSEGGENYTTWNLLFMEEPKKFINIDSFLLSYKYYLKAKEVLSSEGQ